MFAEYKLRQFSNLHLFLFVFLFFSIGTNAQDLIILQNGSDVQAKVLEVTSDEVKYKLTANLDGPVYVLPKSKIFMIKYESGVKEVFSNSNNSNNSTPAPTNTYPAQNQQTSPTTSYQPTNNLVPVPPENYRKAKRHYISLNPLGLSLPYGNFASTDTSGGGIKSGFATFGYSGNLEGAYFPHPNIGIGSQFAVTTNGVNDSQNQALIKSGTGGTQWQFNITPWTSVYIVAGPIASIPFKNSSLDFKLLAGYLNVSSPAYNYNGTNNGYYLNFQQSSVSTESLIILPGINYRLFFSKRVGVKFSLDVMITNPSLYSTTVSYSSNAGGVGSQSGNYTFTVPVGNINLSGGIFIGLGK
jgi:hypothetical protein